MAEFNRRHFPRQNAEDTIQVLLIPDDFEGFKDSCDLIPATIVNQSDNGLYIEIDRNLQPGVECQDQYGLPGRISSGGSALYARWTGYSV